MSLRPLKFHEKKLLKKVNFLQWKTDNSGREVEIIRRYLLQDREDYLKYNKIVGRVHQLVHKLKAMDAEDPVRIKMTDALLEKLYTMALITTEKSLANAEKITASSFCRRRLPVVMVKCKMAETLREAVAFVEHGHVRVGPETVTDPAFLVTRSLEDFVTWVDSSKIKRTIMKYNDRLDDFDLMT